ncbi:hypothetical protein DUI87_28904 [Hirundo rustica rustica]|uniref:Uncharacterized protein n=1 Tax=Hirundo rustica rustica TaxID=333673 RepID=A0A3M0J7B9_HIRRU|nr:hypothetical protein DUI87_28904 [Hirundo rustica rustica]
MGTDPTMIIPQAQAEGLRAHEVMTITHASREAIRSASKQNLVAPSEELQSVDRGKASLRLRLSEGLHLKDADWTFVSVNTEEQGAWPAIEGEFIVIGDCKHTPQEIEILPATLVNNPGSLILWLRCTYPPTYLPKGQIIAQVILTRGPNNTREAPVACPVQAITEERPQVASADKAIIHHYMDDVLVCALNDDVLSHVLDLTINALIAAGFELQEEKVQRMPPWRYLGLEISKRTIVPQKLEIRTKVPQVSLDLERPQTQQWEADVAEVEGSPQVAELAAVAQAFERFSEPFNLVTDSAYVAGVVSRVEGAILQEVSNIALFNLLSQLVKLVSHQEEQFYVMHTRSHTDLPGFIAEGNRRADTLAAPAAMAQLPNIFEQAKLSHQLFHQNTPGLVRRFHLTWEQAKAIVAACPSCTQHALPTLSAGVYPRGLKSCEVWQTDVTHFPEFGHFKYIHVSVDTFSGAVFAFAHTGEKSTDAIKRLVQAFSFMGIPRELKTDNGLAYRSKEFCSFLQQWGVEHKTGIPHSPTGTSKGSSISNNKC